MLREHRSAGIQGWFVVGGTIGEHLLHSANS
jgi:hypothetical protein